MIQPYTGKFAGTTEAAKIDAAVKTKTALWEETETDYKMASLAAKIFFGLGCATVAGGAGLALTSIAFSALAPGLIPGGIFMTLCALPILLGAGFSYFYIKSRLHEIEETKQLFTNNDWKKFLKELEDGDELVDDLALYKLATRANRNGDFVERHLAYVAWHPPMEDFPAILDAPLYEMSKDMKKKIKSRIPNPFHLYEPGRGYTCLPGTGDSRAPTPSHGYTLTSAFSSKPKPAPGGG